MPHVQYGAHALRSVGQCIIHPIEWPDVRGAVTSGFLSNFDGHFMHM